MNKDIFKSVANNDETKSDQIGGRKKEVVQLQKIEFQVDTCQEKIRSRNSFSSISFCLSFIVRVGSLLWVIPAGFQLLYCETISFSIFLSCMNIIRKEYTDSPNLLGVFYVFIFMHMNVLFQAN